MVKGMPKYMTGAKCGNCGTEMIQAAAGTTVYHVCPYCGNCFSMTANAENTIHKIPRIMTEEDVRIISMAEEKFIK